MECESTVSKAWVAKVRWLSAIPRGILAIKNEDGEMTRQADGSRVDAAGQG